MTPSEQWVDRVVAECDAVFALAEVGFVRQLQRSGPGDAPVSALLWEADPALFAERYPDSGVVESYGGPDAYAEVHCIDYWIYLDAPEGYCRMSVEGWNLHELMVELTGHAGFDGPRIADIFARILGVPSPRA